VLALAAMGGGGLAALIGGVFLWSQLGAHRTHAPAPPPVPVPVPAIIAPPVQPSPTHEAPHEPAEQPAVEVELVSTPEGAKVYENDQFVCETPCTIQHPPHAPLPRTFVFRNPGYRDMTHEMTDAKGPISIQMIRARGAPAPANPTSTAPRPSIGRDR
jgi:hypothetical protein